MIIGCASTNPQLKQVESNIDELSREDEVIGDSLPSWVEENGIEDGRLNVVGYSEMSADKSPHYIKKVALMDGETKLLSDAPSDFRILTQNALTGAGIDSSEFYQIQTKLQEVFAVTGFKTNKATCRKIKRYGETKISLVRGCWVQVSASVIKLQQAYANTLAIKYGQGQVNQFKNLMNQELNKINNHRRYDNEMEHSNQTSDNRNNISDSQVRVSPRLSANRVQENNQQSPSNRSNGQGRHLSSSRD